MTNQPKNIGQFLNAHQKEIARALPKHMNPDRMARIALTECRKTPELLDCNPATLFGAFIQCAQLGLEPGAGLGHAYVIPFKNRKQGTVDVQLIIGYRGMIDLARRSGQILSLQAHAVYKKDHFEYEYGLNERLEHRPYGGADRGPLIAVYAVAKLVGGGHQIEVMQKHEVDAIKAQSKTANFGPWKTHEEEMAKKTVIRRLFKYLPVSVEIQNAAKLDELGESNVDQGLDDWIETEYEPVTNVQQVEQPPQAIQDKSHEQQKLDELMVKADKEKVVKENKSPADVIKEYKKATGK